MAAEHFLFCCRRCHVRKNKQLLFPDFHWRSMGRRILSSAAQMQNVRNFCSGCRTVALFICIMQIQAPRQHMMHLMQYLLFRRVMINYGRWQKPALYFCLTRNSKLWKVSPLRLMCRVLLLLHCTEMSCLCLQMMEVSAWYVLMAVWNRCKSVQT